MTPPTPGREPAATLANWRTPPFNRWAFRHIDQLLPTAPINRGGRPPPALAQALAEPLRLITHDRAVAAYSDSVILV